MFLEFLGDNPPLLWLSQGSSPTLWSPCLRSGSASPSPASSARPWWVTCTRTRPAGAAYDTHTHLQTRKRTPMLRSPSLKEEERGKTSLNLSLVSQGVSSSFVNGGEERLSTSLFVLQHIFSHCWLFTGSESGSTGWGGSGLDSREMAPSAGAEDCSPTGKKKMKTERDS